MSTSPLKQTDLQIDSGKSTPRHKLVELTKVALLHEGIDKARVQSSEELLTSISEHFNRLNMHKYPTFRSLLADSTRLAHGQSTVMIAHLMGQALGTSRDHSIEVLGIAGLFHDIGLIHLPIELQTEDESKMSEEEITAFRKHPQIGAQLLHNIPRVDPLAVQLIAQHHERQDDHGFPTYRGGSRTHILAELIGISEVLSHLIEEAYGDKGKKPTMDPFKELRKLAKTQFSDQANKLIAEGLSGQ